MTRHNAEPNTDTIDKKSSLWHWRQTVKPSFNDTIACLWDKSDNRTRGQFEYDVTCFCFCFDFIRSHAQCGCYSIVCLRFQVVQIKQVDCKMSTKNVNNYKYFMIFLGNCTHESIQPRKRRYVVRLRLNEKKSIGEWDLRLKLDVQGKEGGRILDVDGQRGLENWTIFMDVICVSSLISVKIQLNIWKNIYVLYWKC